MLFLPWKAAQELQCLWERKRLCCPGTSLIPAAGLGSGLSREQGTARWDRERGTGQEKQPQIVPGRGGMDVGEIPSWKGLAQVSPHPWGCHSPGDVTLGDRGSAGRAGPDGLRAISHPGQFCEFGIR